MAVLHKIKRASTCFTPFPWLDATLSNDLLKNEGLETTLSNDQFKNERLVLTLLNDPLKNEELELMLSNDQLRMRAGTYIVDSLSHFSMISVQLVGGEWCSLGSATLIPYL
jgi:hypothetical protein